MKAVAVDRLCLEPTIDAKQLTKVNHYHTIDCKYRINYYVGLSFCVRYMNKLLVFLVEPRNQIFLKDPLPIPAFKTARTKTYHKLEQNSDLDV